DFRGERDRDPDIETHPRTAAHHLGPPDPAFGQETGEPGRAEIERADTQPAAGDPGDRRLDPGFGHRVGDESFAEFGVVDPFHLDCFDRFHEPFRHLHLHRRSSRYAIEVSGLRGSHAGSAIFVCFGMSAVSAMATQAAATEIRKVVWKASRDGRTWLPRVMVILASTALITAAEVDVPTERISAFNPFAAAVSVTGTAPMISAGIAA